MGIRTTQIVFINMREPTAPRGMSWDLLSHSSLELPLAAKKKKKKKTKEISMSRAKCNNIITACMTMATTEKNPRLTRTIQLWLQTAHARAINRTGNKPLSTYIYVEEII